MSNVIELRLLDHCVHLMCHVMDVMTNLRQYYSNSHKITKREDISNPFEVLERQTLEVENIVEKNKYFTILFFSQLYTHLHTCQKYHPYSLFRQTALPNEGPSSRCPLGVATTAPALLHLNHCTLHLL